MDILGVPAPLALLTVAVVGVTVAAIVLPRPGVALGLLMVVACTSVSDAVSGVAPVSPYLAAVATATVALLLAVRSGRVRPFWSPVLTAALVFLAFRAGSLAVATNPAVARVTVVEEIKDVFVLIVVATLCASLSRLRPAVAVTVLGLAALAGLTVVQEFVLSNSTTLHGLSNVPIPSELPGLLARHSGPEADVNFWARTLLLFVPFALSLAVGQRSARRWLWLLSAAVLAAGVYLTQSRGGLLALAAAVLVWLALYFRSVMKVAVVTLGLAGAALIAVPGVGSRLATVSSVDVTGPTADQSLVDRAAVQKIGWAMSRDHLLLGVGAGNFTVVEPDYRRRLTPELSQIIAPHNVLLEMLAEGGVVGLAGWLLLYGTALVAAVRALLLLRGLDGRGPPSGATLLAIASVSGLAGWAMASVVLHLADFQILLIVMGMAAALDVRARALAFDRGVVVPPAVAARPFARRRFVAVLAVGIVALAGLAGVLRLPRPILYTTSTRVLVAPADLADGAYVYDVLSRPSIVTTYAALFRNRGLLADAAHTAGLATSGNAQVRVTQLGHSAGFTVSVTSRDRSETVRLSQALVLVVSSYVESLDPLYVLRPTL